jgi:hypothetical protein
MEKFTRLAPRVRVLLALPALATIPLFAACGDDDPAWPSTRPVESVLIQKVPQGAPSLIIQTYGDSLRLLGVPVDADGTFVDAPVSWASSRPGLADVVTHVGADGRTYGVLKFAASPSYANPTNVDTVTITATAGGQTGTMQVIVREDPRVEVVAMSNHSPFQAVGAQITITATPRDGFGNAIPAPSEWTWETSAPSVATVTPVPGTNTATVTFVGLGTANITASVVNLGEPAATGTVVGTRPVSAPPPLSPGTTNMPTLAEGGFHRFTINVPAGTTSLDVRITAAATGDPDMYLYAPGLIPAGGEGGARGATCSPYVFGFAGEICTIPNPTPGTWGVEFHAYPGDGDLTGMTVQITLAS